MRPEHKLRQIYTNKVAALEEMRSCGNLSRDWGECSLICARETLREFNLYFPNQPATENPAPEPKTPRTGKFREWDYDDVAP
jgi:hypothetical protein